ncbi:Schizosaccharomyces specific protein [Schizosaccharomyces osmophilus]|uniref:Schizosaccharomyces specific protein n=1 Tax=Schizosaccharomyces osmophilus TaxID=2545709 RepID=A0AAE9WFR8_9SCHI|nr:Schizosaccharomyces specific protein [Schizosaccharomyces osmophilus]WBW75596.1 Schizosaccharomyces specific protein [Schizosaccharomyces osmophilus]
MFFFVFAGFALIALVVSIVMMIHSYFLKRRQKAAGQAKTTSHTRPSESGTVPSSQHGDSLQTETVMGFPGQSPGHYTTTYRHPEDGTRTTVTENQPEEIPPPYSAAVRESAPGSPDLSESLRGEGEITPRVSHERPRSPPPVYLPPEEMV